MRINETTNNMVPILVSEGELSTAINFVVLFLFNCANIPLFFVKIFSISLIQ